VADALLLPVERVFPIYARGNTPPVKYVVVLGGGHNWDPSLPVSSQLSDQSVKRLIEGIRIFRENPGSKLVLSGGSWPDSVPNARLLADLAQQLGVASDDILAE